VLPLLKLMHCDTMQVFTPRYALSLTSSKFVYQFQPETS